MSEVQRLSVPGPRRLPRDISEAERRGLRRIADVLIGPTGETPAGGQVPDIDQWLDRAVLARRDGFDGLMAVAARFEAMPCEEVGPALRELNETDSGVFELVSGVIAGAYLMSPSVRAAIGYPGQERHYPPFDQVAEEVHSGILDAVIERGPLIREPGGPPWAGAQAS